VRIERIRDALRYAYLPGETEPVSFGFHGAIAEHYGIDSAAGREHATTLDYIVAAASG
jgi:hypothetical protein